MATRRTRSATAKEAAFLQSPSGVASEEPQQLSSPPATPQPSRSHRARPKISKPKSVKKESTAVTPNSSRKRVRASLKDEDEDELPHNLGKISTLAIPKYESQGASLPKKQRPKARRVRRLPTVEETKSLFTKVDAQSQVTEPSPSKKGKKAKDSNYGLMPGQTPFPDWPHPTPEECHEVVRLLSTVHGEVKAPKAIPPPSLTVSGCGEVPSVLDALIRTRLSAATSGTNSSRAFQGLVNRFGILESGIGKGSVNWDAVRRAPVKEIFEAIKSGGLADVKSKDIKTILQMVYEENQARRNALVSALKPDSPPVAGAENESAAEKNAEVERADANVISLDHLHALPSDEAFKELIKYPGIGPKTASCVLLFCLQRPSFAVDTHVFRLCKWLGWVPADKATRNSTYAHCEVRIPDELKYPLHQLFIKHGKTCPRCRAITGEGSKDWDQGCVIDHLVQRTGGRKGGEGSSLKKAAAKKGKGKKAVDDDEESSDLSDLDEEAELSAFEE